MVSPRKLDVPLFLPLPTLLKVPLSGDLASFAFLDISLGSLAELSYIFLLARDLGYIKAEIWGEIEAIRDHAGRLTWGLYRALAAKRPGI